MTPPDEEPLLSLEGRRIGAAAALLLVALLAILRTSGGAFGAPGPAPTSTEKAVPATSRPSATPEPPTPTLEPTSTPTPTPTPTATPTETPTGPAPYTDWARASYGPPWKVDCSNEAIEDGYIQGSWARDFCVPGLITYDAWWFDSPSDFYGLMSSYAVGVMEAQLRHKSIPEGKYKDGVALMSCGDIGKEVWLRRPGGEWEGPFVSVDCSQRNHMYYHNVGMGLAVEIGWKTTQEWGARVLQRIDVHIGSRPGSWDGVYYAYWWTENKLAWEPLPAGFDPED